MKHLYYILIGFATFFFAHCGKEEQKAKGKDYSFEVKETFDKKRYEKASKKPGLRVTEDFTFSFEIQSQEQGIEYEVYHIHKAQVFAEDGSIIEKSIYYPLKEKTLQLRFKPEGENPFNISVKFRNKNDKEKTLKDFHYTIYFYENKFQIERFSVQENQPEEILYQGMEKEAVFKIKTRTPSETFYIKFDKENALDPYHEKSVIKFENTPIVWGQWIKIPNIDKFRIKLMSWASGTNLIFYVKNSTTEVEYSHFEGFWLRKIRLSTDFNFSKKITKRIGEALPITGQVFKTEKLSNKVWVTSSVTPNNAGLETFTKKEVTLTDTDEFVLNVPTHKAGIYNYKLIVEDEFGNKTEKTFENIKVQQNDFTISLRPKQTQTFVGGYLPIAYTLAVLDNDNPNETDFSFTFDDRGNRGYVVLEKSEGSLQYRAGQRIPIRPDVAEFYYVSPNNRGNKTISFTFRSGETTKPAIEVRQEFIGELFSADIQHSRRMKVNQWYPITLSLRATNGVHQPNITYGTTLNKKARHRGVIYNIGEKVPLEYPSTSLEILEEDPTNNIDRREQTQLQARVENSSGMVQSVQTAVLLFRPFTIGGFEYSLKVDECPRDSDFTGSFGYDYNSSSSQKEEVRLFLTSNDVFQSDDMNTLSGVQLEFDFKNERDYTNVQMYPIDVQSVINNRFGEQLFYDNEVCRRPTNSGYALLDKEFIVKARLNGHIIWQGEVSAWADEGTRGAELDGRQRYYVRLYNKKVFVN